MNILELWRYPVKSLQGERLDAAEVTAHGLQGDRAYGIVDVDTGYVLTGRREPRLLFASAAWHDGEVVITGPDGERARRRCRAQRVARSVPSKLRAAGAAGTYETQLDFEHEDTARVVPMGGTGRDVPRLDPHPGVDRRGRARSGSGIAAASAST